MNIALCDDDAAELKTIHGIIDNWAMKNGVVIHVYEFCRGEVLRNTLLDDKKYDAFVLDVMMPEMDGITLARKLRDSNRVADEAPIIFLTSSRDYAVESYEVKAFYYLLKPVAERKLEEVLESAYGQINKIMEDVIFVRTAEGEYYLRRTDIFYVSFQNRVMDFACTERHLKSLAVQNSFKKSTLCFDEDDRFFRCGASLILNLARIRSIDKNIVTFAAGEELYVPRSAAKELYQAWLDYWL